MREDEKNNQRTYVHSPWHRQQCGERQRKEKVGNGGEEGTSVILSTITIKYIINKTLGFGEERWASSVSETRYSQFLSFEIYWQSLDIEEANEENK